MRTTGIVFAIASLGVVGLGQALADDANDNRGVVRAPPASAQAGSQADVPASRANDAATGAGRIDPRQVRATGGARLSPESAAQIATLLMASSEPRRLDIDANVGAPLPGDVDVRPLPTPVADLVPEYRGFEYAVARDRIVIVEPSTRRIVEVIAEVGGPR